MLRPVHFVCVLLVGLLVMFIENVGSCLRPCCADWGPVALFLGNHLAQRLYSLELHLSSLLPFKDTVA